MMFDWRVLVAIGVLGLVSYVLRSGGFLAAGLIREDGSITRFLRLAPGNLFIAFVAAACFDGGLPSMIGSTAAIVGMLTTRKEWVALTAGFAAAAVAAAFLPAR
jgi:uncharacterized membrane protein